MITATGIGSGLDIDSLVSQLVSAERAGSDLQLNRESSKINVELSAFSSLKSSLTNFQSSLSSLDTLANYRQNNATSSDVAFVSVSASESAIPSDYSVEVSQLAEKHALASTAVADIDKTAIGTGTLTIRFGTTDYVAGSDTYNSFTLNPESSTAVLAIDSSNNTLEGIMTAINDADIDVNASIVNDGSGFRLLLTSAKSGLENSLEIAVDDDDGNDADVTGLSVFTFNATSTNLSQTRAAQDAQFTINGITVGDAENSVTDAIPGTTLTLNKVTTAPVAITVSEDTQSIVNAVNSFVSGYNNFRNTVNSLTAYDAENKIAGNLQGDFTVRSIVSQIDNVMRNNISGLSGDFTNMAELGLNTDKNGNLILDTVKFNEVLASNKEDVIGIFTALGLPDNAIVEFQSVGSNAQEGTYAINITQLASSGTLGGSAVLPDFAMGGTLTIDADNDDFTVEVDGVDSGALKLTAGTYTTGHDLAAELQTQINGASTLKAANKTVSVTYEPGSDRMVITSSSEGNSSTVNLLSVDTDFLAELGLDAVNGTAGLDVSGTIGGEAATGAGRLLSGAEGTTAEGLNLVINSTVTGAMGNVSLTRGIANQIDLYLEQLLEAEEGTIESRLDSLETRKTQVEQRREEQELKWSAIEERYLRQFNALDSLLSSLQSTSSFLESQLSNLPKPNSINRN